MRFHLGFSLLLIWLLSGCAAIPALVGQPWDTVSPSPIQAVPPTAQATGLGAADLQALRPNEVGWILVLEYHLILPGEDSTYSRTPESLRADLEWLYANEYYPIRFRDLTSGYIDVPAGRAPVVLTFDDSDISQFRMLTDGTVDPQSGMGVLLAFAEAHPDFPAVATFFPLQDVDVPERILFGQPEFADAKLKMIVELGGEVGSHTVSHERLDLVSEERIRWQLAHSQQWLEDRIGNGYEVVSLSLPFGSYPLNDALIRSGESEGIAYAYTGAAKVAGDASWSPFSQQFDPYYVDRAQAIPGYIDGMYGMFERRPTLKFISDGDPNTITVPSEATLDPEQQGVFDEARWAGQYEIVRYERE